MTRTVAAAVILSLVVVVPQVMAMATTPLSATLEWQEAVAVGDVTLDGGIVGLHIPLDLRHEPPTAAVFILDAERVEVLEESRDYAQAGEVSVSTDNEWRISKDSLVPAHLRMSTLRDEVMVLVGLQNAEGPVSSPVTRIAAPGALVTGVERVDQPFFPPRLTEHGIFQRHVCHDAPAIAVSVDGPSESIVIEGDFVIYLWDLDVSEAETGRTFQSGQLYSNQQAQTDQTPDGVAAQKRKQMLTLTVHAGRLTLALPGRPVTAFADPASTRLETSGSWDLVGATGSVSLAGLTSQVQATDVHVAGEFATTFDGAAFPIQGHWQGSAVEAMAAREALPAGAAPVARSGPAAWWPLALGIALLGVGGASTWGGRMWLQRRSQPATAAEAQPFVNEATDELVTQAISLMEQGQAQRVIASLEPGFDPADPSAAVRAYLLSLAHVHEGRNEESVTWFLRAIEYFPEFSEELGSNPAFVPIRDDPRIRRIINRQGVTGYV